MSNKILEFLEAYKSLDELCKQILSSEKGISEYIDEMSKEQQAHLKVFCWENDYKQLKRMRWIRNRLVHETNSFEDNLITMEDIEWLQDFRSRIMKCTDSYSLLYQSRNVKRKAAVNQDSHIKSYVESKNTKRKATSKQENCSETSQQLRIMSFVVGGIILLVILAIIFSLK